MIKGNTIRPDAQAFDEVRITTVPRFKESELSGNEWRISAKVEFLRNGVVKHEWHCGNVEYAVQLLNARWIEAGDEAKGYFASEGSFCDQEGCANPATIFMEKKFRYCRDGHKEDAKNQIRQFCERHSDRGDCGLDDADGNYNILDTRAPF